MDEAGNHPQQTKIGTEYQTLHVLTHRQVMKYKNIWTQGRDYYTLGSIGGNRGGTAREWGREG